MSNELPDPSVLAVLAKQRRDAHLQRLKEYWSNAVERHKKYLAACRRNPECLDQEACNIVDGDGKTLVAPNNGFVAAPSDGSLAAELKDVDIKDGMAASYQDFIEYTDPDSIHPKKDVFDLENLSVYGTPVTDLSLHETLQRFDIDAPVFVWLRSLASLSIVPTSPKTEPLQLPTLTELLRFAKVTLNRGTVFNFFGTRLLRSLTNLPNLQIALNATLLSLPAPFKQHLTTTSIGYTPKRIMFEQRA